MKNEPELFPMVVGAWRTAAQQLDISIQAPFSLGERVSRAIAYLPDFGGPNGMVIGLISPPDLLPDQPLREAARRAGFYCSFINAEEFCCFNEKLFAESLADWGFFGNPLLSPKWWPGSKK